MTFGKLWLSRRALERRVLWDTLHAPVHAEAVHGDCDAHALCAICLDSVCTSSVALSNEPLRTLRRRAPSLAICRRGPGASIAAARVSALRGMSPAYVARVVCGHMFHPPCLSIATQHRLECPVCRHALGDEPLTHVELTLWEDLHVIIGGLVMVVFDWLRPTCLQESLMVLTGLCAGLLAASAMPIFALRHFPPEDSEDDR